MFVTSNNALVCLSEHFVMSKPVPDEQVKVRNVPPLEMLPRYGAVGLTEAIHRLIRFNSVHETSDTQVVLVFR